VPFRRESFALVPLLASTRARAGFETQRGETCGLGSGVAAPAAAAHRSTCAAATLQPCNIKMGDEHTAVGSLLGLVARAQALVAELLRLSDRVPPVFTPEHEPKYADILFDFRYLKASTVPHLAPSPNQARTPTLNSSLGRWVWYYRTRAGRLCCVMLEVASEGS